MLQLRRGTLVGLAFTVCTSLIGMTAPQAWAAGDDALQILKAMSTYLASQKTVSMTFDSAVEVITPDLEKIQFTSSGTLLLARPNEIHATRTGGYSDVEFFFDGKTLTAYGKNKNIYAQLDAPGTVDQLVDKLRERGFVPPGADLLLADVYGALNGGIISSKHVGEGVVEGVECEHLAFRNQDTDWQLWVETGDKPMPRKYVITSKAIGGAPQYTLVIRDWKTGVPADAATFAFKAPAGAQKIDLDAIPNLDEIPPSAPAKGQ
jgi:hypothetical protein